MQIDTTKIPESEAIVNFIVSRVKKGLGCIILVVGAPGLGKSYCCGRLGELVTEKLYPGEKFSVDAVVDNPTDCFAFVRKVEKPSVLVVEEISVLFSSRRAMSLTNVEFNSLIDTCRKKQVVLIMNSQHIDFVDKHIRMLSHLLIECLRINKQKKICILKPLRLQTNQSSGKTYKHRLWNGGKEIHRCYVNIPSKEWVLAYEHKKSKFMENLYHTMELKSKHRIAKEDKQIGKHRRPLMWKTELTDRQSDCHAHINLKGMGIKEYAELRGITPRRVYELLQIIQNKAVLLGKVANTPYKAKKNSPTS